jgi:hypothetical protein
MNTRDAIRGFVMRWHLFLLVGGLAPLAGCHLAETAFHNAVNEPTMYLDEKHVTHECRAEGRRAVRELQRQQAMSEDYEDGFVDGYADALERGGSPLPPAVPPTKYRRGRFLNPQGHARIHDYFAGFQHGANCATASGQRQYLTVPVLVADPPPEQLPAVQQVPKEQCGPNCPAPGAVSGAPKAATATKPVPTDTTLLPPARPLIAAPVAPPLVVPPQPTSPEVKADAPTEIPAPDGVVPPRPEPRQVVPPKPEPR